MYIIGFSFGYHDASIAILRSNQILGIYSEERFSRKKHDKNFPFNALEYALKEHKISSESIELACYYEDPIIKLHRIKGQFTTNDSFTHYLCARLINKDLSNPLVEISQALDIPINKPTAINVKIVFDPP